jgi:predicted secreted protein
MKRLLPLSLLTVLLLAGVAARSAAAEFDFSGSGKEAPASSPTPVKLVVTTVRDVANDTMEAVLSIEAEERDLARLADSVRQSVAGAVKTAQESPYIQVTTGAYRTYPIYDRYDPYRFSHWRGVQEIYLSSTQFPALEDVLGRLQGKAFVKSVGFSLSPQERRRAEDKLVEDAVKAFLVRADLVQKALKASSYRVTALEVTVEPTEKEPPSRAALPPGRPAEESLRATVRGAVELQ